MDKLEDKTNKEFEKYSKEDLRILGDLKKKGLTAKELQTTINALNKGNPYQQNDYRIGKSHVKYLVFGDTHIGNIHYDSKLMTHAAKMASKEKVDFIIHTGDMMDGWYQNRPQSIFEQDAIGLDQQFKKQLKN